MVYATCSLLALESEDQVRKLLARGDTQGEAVMKTVPFKPGEIPGFDNAIDENGWLRVLPGVLEGDLSSCDGFFVARLQKVG
jgi:16S rRNA C967 or C1407 C5-methylase (RsmB/RsmF family)